MAPTRQELVLTFMVALAESGAVNFSKESIDNVFVMAEALADKYLASL
jgi:hypothetical protein